MTTSNDKNITQVKAALNAARQSLLAYFEPEQINVNDVLEVIKASIGQWTNQWQAVSFHGRPSNYNQILNLLHECQDTRNRWAHGVRFTLDDTHRAMDTIHRLLSELGDQDRAAEINRQRQELRRALIHQQTSQEQTTSARSSLTTGIDAANLRNALERFLTSYLGTNTEPAPFGGRQGQMAALDTWLNSTESACALLLAPAGRGKSALVSQWADHLVREQHAAVAFAPISLRFNTTSRADVAKLLGSRLAYLCQPAASQPSDTDGWIAEIVAMVQQDRAPGAPPLLVILDGLDEAVAWEPGRDLVLPNPPGKGVHILVTTRILANCTTEDWLQRLHWDTKQTTVFDLPLLDQAGIADVLHSIDASGETADMPDDILQELIRLSDGDPLLIRLYVDDLRKARREGRTITAQDLSQRPSGLEGFLDGWWEDQRRAWGVQTPLREPAVRAILNLLTNALGPLTTDDVLALAEPEGIDSWLLDMALQNLDRLVVGDGTAQGYSFTHPKLAYHLAERLTEQERRQWSQRFLDYGAHTLASLQDGSLDAAATSAYCVRFYRAHLVQAGADLDQFAPLVNDTWFRAWAAHDASYDGFLNDIAEIWKLADTALVQGRGEPSAAIAMQCRCLLSQVSVNSLGMHMTAPLLRALVEAGMWTVRQALAHCIRVPDQRQRAELILALAPYLESAIAAEILERIRKHFPTPYHQARALLAIAEQLSTSEAAQVYTEVRTLVSTIAGSIDQAEILSLLARHFPSEIDLDTAFRQALETYNSEAIPQSVEIKRAEWIRSVLESHGRLHWLIENIPDHLLADTVSMLQHLAEYIDPTPYLQLLLNRLPEALLPAVRDTIIRALDTSLNPEQRVMLSSDTFRGTVAQTLGPMSDRERQVLVDALLERLWHVNQSNFQTLITLIWPYCNQNQVPQIEDLQEQHGITVDEARRAIQLPENFGYYEGRIIADQAYELLKQVRELIRKWSDETAEDCLPPVQDVYQQIRQCANPADRAQLLLAILPLLPDDEHTKVLQEAREAARAIQWSPSETLSGLIQKQRQDWTQEDYYGFASFTDFLYQGRAFTKIASHPQHTERSEMLQTAYESLRERSSPDAWLLDPDGLIPQLIAADMFDQAFKMLEQLLAKPPNDLDWVAGFEHISHALVTCADLAAALPRLQVHLQQIKDRTARHAILLNLSRAFGAAQPEQVQAVLRTELETDFRINDESARGHLLVALAPYLSADADPNLLVEITLFTGMMEDSEFTMSHPFEDAMEELCPILSDEQYETLLEHVIDSEEDDRCELYMRALILVNIVPHFPLDYLRDMIDRIPWIPRTIDDYDNYWIYPLLERIASTEGEDAALDMLEKLVHTKGASWIQDDPVDPDHITAKFDEFWENVDNGNLWAISDLAETAAKFPDATDRDDAVSDVLALLAEPAFAANDNESLMHRALKTLAPHLEGVNLDTAYEIARNQSSYPALRAIAEVLNGDAREECLQEALQALPFPAESTQFTRYVWLNTPQFESVRELQQLLQLADAPPQWQRAVFEHIQAIEADDIVRANALLVLAPHLDLELHDEVFEIIQTLTDPIVRTMALAHLSTCNDFFPTNSDQIIDAALAGFDGLDSQESHVTVLRLLAPHACRTDYATILLARAQELEAELWRSTILARLLVHQSPAAHLDRVDTLLAFDFFQIQFAPQRIALIKDIATVIARLPEGQALPRWSSFLARFRGQSRPELMFNLMGIIPALEAIGGRESITMLVEAVFEHGEWYP